MLSHLDNGTFIDPQSHFYFLFIEQRILSHSLFFSKCESRLRFDDKKSRKHSKRNQKKID